MEAISGGTTVMDLNAPSPAAEEIMAIKAELSEFIGWDKKESR